jgi:putative RNA 2'-phosphotransferase
MSIKRNELSRAMSHALRHEPWLYELELDEEGWVSVDALVTALRCSTSEWSELSRADIDDVVANADKIRHEIVGNRVRALYGHSIPGRLRREPAIPPAMLFHGTSLAAADAILHDGLKPMGRQYVHLSVDKETADQVGRRKSDNPILLKVDAAAAHADGVCFYAGNDKVWLVKFLPACFVSTC